MWPNLDINDDISGFDSQSLWDYDLTQGGGLVVQVVIDTSEAAVLDRSKLWVDGVQIQDLMNPPVTMLPPAPERDDQYRQRASHDVWQPRRQRPRVDGRHLLLALYNVAQTDLERENNRAALTANDDAPQ